MTHHAIVMIILLNYLLTFNEILKQSNVRKEKNNAALTEIYKFNETQNIDNKWE